MGSGRNVAVFGAYGHTGRFVVAELRERGYVPLLLGRDQDKRWRWRRPNRGSRRGGRRSTIRPRSTAR